MDEYNQELETIRETLSEEDMLIQLAEEAAELAQAALKLKRALSGNNPARKPAVNCRKDLLEEFTDVMVAATVYGINPDRGLMGYKLTRWAGGVRREV